MKQFIIPEGCSQKLLKNWYDLERLAYKFKSDSLNEASLFPSKWGDYQIIHPVNSNIIFFEEYKWLYKQYYKKYIDFQEAKVKRGVKKENLYDNEKATIKAIIKARIEADKMGIPYGLYISFAFRIVMSRYLWQNLPLPTQISFSDLVKDIEYEWKESCQYDFLQPLINLNVANLK